MTRSENRTVTWKLWVDTNHDTNHDRPRAPTQGRRCEQLAQSCYLGGARRWTRNPSVTNPAP